MDKITKEILDWAEQGAELSSPSWEQLPSIPLYMDQVILYLKDSLSFFERDESASLLTRSMINNYVKNGVLPHPDKKKYAREHLGALMAVCLLKQVLSIQDIAVLFSGQELSGELYEAFRSAHLSAVHETCRELEDTCRSESSLKEAALRLAAEAAAKRTAAERILSGLGSRDNSEGNAKEKSKNK